MSGGRKRKRNSESSSSPSRDQDFDSDSSLKRKGSKTPVDLVTSGKGKGKSPHISNVTVVSVEDFGADSSFDDVEDRDEPKRIIKRRKKKQKFNCKVCDAKVYKAQKKLFTACAICGDMAHAKCIKDRSKEWICKSCVGETGGNSHNPNPNPKKSLKKDSSLKTVPGILKKKFKESAQAQRRPTRGSKSAKVDYSQYTCPTCGFLTCACKGTLFSDILQDDEESLLFDDDEEEEEEEDDDVDESESDLEKNLELEEEDEFDILLPLSHSSHSARLFVNESDGSETEDVMSIDSQYDSSLESEESSVYEEPENIEFEDEEGVMAELVREKLLNGWENESDEYFEEAEDFFDAASDLENEEIVLEQETLAIQEDVENQEKLKILEELKSGVKLDNSDNEKQATQSVKDKSSNEINHSITTNDSSTNLNQQVKPQSSLKIQNNSSKLLSQLLTFASLKKSNSALNKGSPAMASVSPNVAESNSTNDLSTTASLLPTNLLKRPVNLKSVASTAAAIVSSPAMLKAFKQLNSTKVKETLALHAKIKAAALKAVASGHGIPNGMTLPNPSPSIFKSFESDSKQHAIDQLTEVINDQKMQHFANSVGKNEKAKVEAEIDESTLFEDIFDHGRFEAGSRSPSPLHDFDQSDPQRVEPNTPTDFSRFAKIPIGTFWKSQRKGSKGGISKRKDLQRAIKRSSDFKVLDSTLMENIPKSGSSGRKFKKSNFGQSQYLFSPVLLAMNPEDIAQLSSTNEGVPPSKSLDFLNSPIPPPFIL